MWWEKPSCKSKVWVCFVFKALLHSSLQYRDGLENIQMWQYNPCSVKEYLNGASVYIKEDRRKQVNCFTFSFFWLSFKNAQSMNLTKQFSNSWKLSYIPMITRKVIDKIAQVVTTNFSKNSTPKFNLDTPKIVTL